MKKLLILFLALFISCSSGQNTNKKDFIGITIYRTDDIFANSIKRNIEKFISGKAKYIVNDSQNNQIIQNTQIDNYISKGAKVLAINLVDPKAAQNIVDKAKANDLPIVLFNKAPAASVMSSYDKVWYVGTISEEAAHIQGQLVVDSWKEHSNWDKNNDGKIQCVILMGESGHIDAEIRTENVISFINDSGIKLDVLDTQIGMWNRGKASEIVYSWMEKYGPKIEYIISNNDEIALGALESIRIFGYNDINPNRYIPIVGIDAVDEAITEIENGNMVGTVLNDSIGQAKAVSDIVLNLLKGEVDDPISGTDWKLDNTKSVRVHYKPISTKNIAHN